MNHAVMRRPARTIWRNEQDVLLVSLLTEYRSLLDNRTHAQNHAARTLKQFWDLIARELTARYHIVRNARQCKDRFRLLYTRGIRNMHNGVDPQTGVEALCLELNKMFYLDARNNISLVLEDDQRHRGPQNKESSLPDETESQDEDSKDHDEMNDTRDEIAINEEKAQVQPIPQHIHRNTILTEPVINPTTMPLITDPVVGALPPQMPDMSGPPPPPPFAPVYQDPQIQMLMDQVLMLDRQVADLYARLDELGDSTHRRFEQILGDKTDYASRAGSMNTTTAPVSNVPNSVVQMHPLHHQHQQLQQSQGHHRTLASAAFRPAFPPPVQRAEKHTSRPVSNTSASSAHSDAPALPPSTSPKPRTGPQTRSRNSLS
ncbi:LAFA_0A01222g1_1 [Lachancea sp. 'fantastica']|nr:LAFA_0A01222g1_1 [Lachancea sp. 'fantastica']